MFLLISWSGFLSFLLSSSCFKISYCVCNLVSNLSVDKFLIIDWRSFFSLSFFSLFLHNLLYHQDSTFFVAGENIDVNPLNIVPIPLEVTAIIIFVSSNNAVAVVGISAGIAKVRIGVKIIRDKEIIVIVHHILFSLLFGFSLKSCCCFKKSFTVILFKNWFFLSIKQVFFLYSSIFWYLLVCFQTSILFFSLLSKYIISSKINPSL